MKKKMKERDCVNEKDHFSSIGTTTKYLYTHLHILSTYCTMHANLFRIKRMRIKSVQTVAVAAAADVGMA